MIRSFLMDAMTNAISIYYCITHCFENFLQENQYSKKMISAIKRDGALLVNEKPVTVRKTMEAGDTLVVKLPDELPSVNLEPFEKPLDILFEDTYFIAVSKGKQQNCAPSREHPHGSLIEQVMGYLASKQSGEASPANPHIVTRLDRNTSGIVLFAKHGHFHHMMSHVVMNKIYHCIAEGRIEEAGNIVAPILRASDSIIKRQVGLQENTQKRAFNLFKSPMTLLYARYSCIQGAPIRYASIFNTSAIRF